MKYPISNSLHRTRQQDLGRLGAKYPRVVMTRIVKPSYEMLFAAIMAPTL